MECNNQKKEISLEKFCDLFLDESFDDEQYFEYLKNKKSLLLKPLNQSYPRTIYFEYENDICKFESSTVKSRDIKEIFWNKNIKELNDINLNNSFQKNKDDYKENEKSVNRKFHNFKNSFQKNSDFCIIYKAYKNTPPCLIIPLEKNGIARTKSFLLANLIWKLLKYDKMKVLIQRLNEYQRYNHFPCTWDLGRKDNLWRNFFKLQQIFPEKFNFIPKTFIFPEDFEKFMLDYDQFKEYMWIIKPVASSRGRGIKLLTNINSIPKRCLISKYISNPYLINNKKFDLRLYVLITSYNPLKIYIYKEGLVRFASEEYDCANISSATIKDEDEEEENANANESSSKLKEKKYSKFMYLTNYSLNKNSNNYNYNISTMDECIGSKWSLSALRNFFKEKNLNFENLWVKIKEIIVKAIILNADRTIEEVRSLTDKRNNLFEMYGFDIMIDSELNPWLLEINLNPSLNCDTELDNKIKTTLMTDILNIIGLIPYSHKERKIFVNKKIIDPKTLDQEIELYDNFYGKKTSLKEIDKNDANFELSLDEINDEEKNFNINEKKIKNKKEESNINHHQNSIKSNLEIIKKQYFQNKSEFDIKKHLENYPFDKTSQEIMIYTKEEFSRNKNFDLLFPLKENIDYYSQFILNPEIENIILWSLLRDNNFNNNY